MLLRPSLLLVYIIVFLIIYPEYISTELVTGQPPKLVFFESMLPEKETLKMEQDGTALLQFDEKVIDKIDEPYYNQQLQLMVRCMGKKYTRILLAVFHPKFEMVKKTLSTEFLKAISTENRIKLDQNVNLIDVYLQMPLQLFLDLESLRDIQLLIIGFHNSIAEPGNINGQIFETSLLPNSIQLDQNLGQTIIGAVYLAVKKFGTFLKTLKSSHRHKLKLGLEVSFVEEFEFCMNEDLGDTMSFFEMVVYKHSGTDIFQAHECIKRFQNEFPGMEFHKIKQVFDNSSK